MCCSEQASLGGGGERRELSGWIDSGLRRDGRDARDELRFQGSAADEAPINVRLREEARRVGPLHGAAVLDARRLGQARGRGRQEGRDARRVRSRLEEPSVRALARRGRADGVEADEYRVVLEEQFLERLKGPSRGLP